jgi:hypothetical protein
MAVSTLCSGRTSIGDREEALAHFYAAERNAGATPIEANERMQFFAKRLDEEFERDLDVIRQAIGRK